MLGFVNTFSTIALNLKSVVKASWVLVGPRGCSWVLMGASGSSWVLVGAPGSSWVLVGPRGC